MQYFSIMIQNLEIKTTYYTNGIISSLNSYRDGVLEGVSKNYDSSGAVTNAKIYRNGKLLSEGIIDDEGIKQGFWKEYFLETGKVKAEGEFKEGARFGEWKFYFENGKHWKTQTFLNDTFPLVSFAVIVPLSSINSLFSLRSVSNFSINFWSSLNTLWVSILIFSIETLANSSSGIISSKVYSISYSSSRIIELEGSFIK